MWLVSVELDQRFRNFWFSGLLKIIENSKELLFMWVIVLFIILDYLGYILDKKGYI